jgi:hypothetical protein
MARSMAGLSLERDSAQAGVEMFEGFGVLPERVLPSSRCSKTRD